MLAGATFTINILKVQPKFGKTPQVNAGWQELGAGPDNACQLEYLGFLVMAGRASQPAAKLLSAEEALHNIVQSPMTYNEQIEHEQFVELLHSTLQEAKLNTLWAEACSLSMEQAIRFALKQ